MGIAAVKLSTAPPIALGRGHFISTVTFSVQLHKLHSKVRTSGPSGPATTPLSVIGPWHFGHGGRSTSTGPVSPGRCDMVLLAFELLNRRSKSGRPPFHRRRLSDDLIDVIAVHASKRAHLESAQGG